VSEERRDTGTPPPADGADLQRWVAAGVVATAVIVLSLPLYLVRERIAATERGIADTAPAEFVGRERCISCHEQAFEAWRGSDHDRAMTVASDSTVRGDFDDAVFVYRGDTTRFYRRDGRYYVHAEGSDGVFAEFEITHTFGWEPLQQYLIPFPGGRLQALSVAWDTEREEWFFLYPGRDIPPDDWLHWTRGAQNWNGMCAECHSTNLIKGYDAETQSFATTWSEIDVSCEACHGPGSRHVAWAELPPMARPAVEHYDLVVPTGGITSDAQVALCAPCHNLQPVTKGQILARDGGGVIGAVESGLVLLPLYQGKGDDGFFLAREVSVFWLRLSWALRRMRLNRLVGLLPGVRRHPGVRREDRREPGSNGRRL